jgi:hypothetical protein
MMIGRRGAAGQQQLRHRHGDAELECFGREPGPNRIERLKPWKQLAVERRRQRPSQCLIKMVMGIDQPRQHYVVTGLKGRRGCRRLATPRHQLDDLAMLDDDAAFRSVGENV